MRFRFISFNFVLQILQGKQTEFKKSLTITVEFCLVSISLTNPVYSAPHKIMKYFPTCFYKMYIGMEKSSYLAIINCCFITDII